MEAVWWPTTVSRQKQKPHGKNKIPHGKLNRKSHGKTKYFTVSKMTLVLPWGLWFCREVFGFVVGYFAFAVRFLTRGYAKRRNGFLLGLRYANVSLARSLRCRIFVISRPRTNRVGRDIRTRASLSCLRGRSVMWACGDFEQGDDILPKWTSNVCNYDQLEDWIS